MIRMPQAPSPRRSFATATTVTAIALASVLLGTGTSYAYWNATANATVATTSGDVEVAVGSFTTTTLANHRLAVTFPVTVVNNSVQYNASTLANLQVKLDADPAALGFSANAKVAIWDQAVEACTATSPAPIASGTWAGVTASGMTIGKSVTKTYCVRTSLDRASDAAATSGTNSFTARITATASVGDLSDSDVRTATQSTEYIYPVGSVSANQLWVIHQGSTTGECMDVSGGGTSNPGTDVIRWNDCHKGANQQWQIMGAPTTNYVLIRPRSTPANSVVVTNGTTVKVQTQTGAAGQQWQLQRKGTNQYQIVSLDTGYCLTAATSNSVMTASACSGAATQAFYFEALGGAITTFSPNSFGCTAATSGNPRNLTLAWAPVSNGYAGSFRLQVNDGGYSTVATVGANASGVVLSIANGDYAGNLFSSKNYSYRVVDDSNNIWGSGTFTVSSSLGSPASALTGCAVS